MQRWTRATLMSYQGRPSLLKTRAARCRHTLNCGPRRSHTGATFPRQAQRQRWRTEQGHWDNFSCLRLSRPPSSAAFRWKTEGRKRLFDRAVSKLTDQNSYLFSYPVSRPLCFKCHYFKKNKNKKFKGIFITAIISPSGFYHEKKILNDLKNKTTSGWERSSGNDHQHPEFPHERGLKKQAAVVKHTWLLSPHCSLTFTAEGQKSYTTTCWALWSTSNLPFPALHLPFLNKIGK